MVATQCQILRPLDLPAVRLVISMDLYPRGREKMAFHGLLSLWREVLLWREGVRHSALCLALGHADRLPDTEEAFVSVLSSD